MPWTPERHPPAMEHLPPWVRDQAVEIANALLAEDGDEGRAIRIGLEQGQGMGRASVCAAWRATPACWSASPARRRTPPAWPTSPGVWARPAAPGSSHGTC
ncbi:MAG: hypothetical protein ACXWJJ_05180 [Ramlibacter sp.]